MRHLSFFVGLTHGSRSSSRAAVNTTQFASESTRSKLLESQCQADLYEAGPGRLSTRNRYSRIKAPNSPYACWEPESTKPHDWAASSLKRQPLRWPTHQYNYSGRSTPNTANNSSLIDCCRQKQTSHDINSPPIRRSRVSANSEAAEVNMGMDHLGKKR